MALDIDWKPCEPGMLHDVVREQRQRQRRQTMTRRAAAATVVMAGVGVVYTVLPSAGVSGASLTCVQTRELAQLYVQGDLSQHKSGMVEAHLQHCGSCSDYIAKLASQRHV